MLRSFAESIVVIGLIVISSGAAPRPAAWTDPQTGIAIGGYDPMSYLTHGHPMVGTPELEHHWRGVTWRFYNEGNKAQFVEHPNLYAPRFAGYDIVALSRGLYVHGLPTIWDVYQGRLYLFGSDKSLKMWQNRSADIVAIVEKNWAALSKEIQDFGGRPPVRDLYPSLR